MGRLIDADDLLAEYDRVHVGPPGGARKLIEDAPEVKPKVVAEIKIDNDALQRMVSEVVEQIKAELFGNSEQLDTISRQAAVDALRMCYETETISMDNGDEYINYGDAVAEIEQLPTAQQVRTEMSSAEDLISRQAALDEIRRFSGYLDEDMINRIHIVLKRLPSAQPIYAEQDVRDSFNEGYRCGMEAAQPKQDREFIKLTVRNSNGRPYYSIIYLELDDNGVGHDFEGYSSYSLDVISDYLKKYFMLSAQPETATVTIGKTRGTDILWYQCDGCGEPVAKDDCYCSKCGRRLRFEQRLDSQTGCD